jgi:hypothetical protein
VEIAAARHPRVDQFDHTGQEDGDADDGHAPDRGKQRRQHGDEAEQEQEDAAEPGAIEHVWWNRILP